MRKCGKLDLRLDLFTDSFSVSLVYSKLIFFFISLPFSLHNVATLAGLQTEHTRSPETSHPEACSIQRRKRHSDVIPTASSARSQT